MRVKELRTFTSYFLSNVMQGACYIGYPVFIGARRWETNRIATWNDLESKRHQSKLLLSDVAFVDISSYQHKRLHAGE